eukprot:c2860_g1_i1.p1 GENE.c2860_g1_i1~~c2860_g1_i1.p1  ORF type:complete len:473 (+),score=96.66 c2860_g1_i1:176-1420(+)
MNGHLKLQGFYRELQTALPHRKVITVQQHVAQRYHPGNYRKWTREDLDLLKQLVDRHGNKWNKISVIFGRPPINVKFQYLTLLFDKNPWTEEEEASLNATVQKIALLSGIDVPNPSAVDAFGEQTIAASVQRLPWATIGQLMAPKTGVQCRTKWLSQFAYRADAVKQFKTAADDIDLVERLIKLDVDDESEVNWNHVDPNYFGHSFRARFRVLKLNVSNAPHLEWNDLLSAILTQLQFQRENEQKRILQALQGGPDSGFEPRRRQRRRPDFSAEEGEEVVVENSKKRAKPNDEGESDTATAAKTSKQKSRSSAGSTQVVQTQPDGDAEDSRKGIKSSNGEKANDRSSRRRKSSGDGRGQGKQQSSQETQSSQRSSDGLLVISQTQPRDDSKPTKRRPRSLPNKPKKLSVVDDDK